MINEGSGIKNLGPPSLKTQVAQTSFIHNLNSPIPQACFNDKSYLNPHALAYTQRN